MRVQVPKHIDPLFPPRRAHQQFGISHLIFLMYSKFSRPFLFYFYHNKMKIFEKWIFVSLIFTKKRFYFEFSIKLQNSVLSLQNGIKLMYLKVNGNIFRHWNIFHKKGQMAQFPLAYFDFFYFTFLRKFVQKPVYFNFWAYLTQNPLSSK